MTFRHLQAASAGLLLATALPAVAQSSTQHVDVALFDDSGQVGIGFYDFGPPVNLVTGAKLFTEPLELVETGYHAVAAPGFNNISSQSLPHGAEVFFDIPAITHPFLSAYANASYTVDVRNFLYWDGVDDDNDGDLLDDVAFSPAPAGTTMSVYDNPFVNMTVDGTSSPAEGFSLGGVNNDGEFHEHISFRAQGPGGNQPDDGVYILPMTISADDVVFVSGTPTRVPLIDRSETFYLVLNGVYQRNAGGDIIYNGFLALTEDAAGVAATQWVEEYLVRDLGDFNDSGDLDADDIDQLFAQQGLADPGFGFDLTGDGLVTVADLDRWVYDLAGTRYGDANLDRSIDLIDFDALATSFGASGGWAEGDFNGDGMVNLIDFDILAIEFGFSAAVTADLAAAIDAGNIDSALAVYAANVPEPATAALLAVGGLAAFARRRRSSVN